MIATRTALADDLRRLGIRAGAVMAHARMSALGTVAGGAETLVHALLDAVGPDGTVVAYTGWADEPDLDALDAADRERVLAEHPVFDPARAHARREHGRLAEAIRTWPGAVRSRHPEAGVAAVGARAAWVCAEHPWDDAYGAGTPYARIVEADGQVAALGARRPPRRRSSTTPRRSRGPGSPPRRASYAYPLLIDGRRAWRTLHDIDTGSGAYGYPAVLGDVDHVGYLADAALAAGHGREGPLGAGTGRVLEARGLVAHAVAWIEAAFGPAGE